MSVPPTTPTIAEQLHAVKDAAQTYADQAAIKSHGSFANKYLRRQAEHLTAAADTLRALLDSGK